MIKYILIILAFFTFTPHAHAIFVGTSTTATFQANTDFFINGSSTASNVNAGTFNRGNLNFPTDGTFDIYTATSSAPVFSSASNTFVASDISHYLFIEGGFAQGIATSSCYYPVASVSGGKATLNASVGAGWCIDAYRNVASTTWVGVATSTQPAGVIWGLNQAMATTATVSFVASGGVYTNDLQCTNAVPSSCSSVSYNFRPADIGNGLHVTAGTNATTSVQGQWREIMSVSGGSATLDYNVTTGAGDMTGGTARLGGAVSLGSGSDNEFFNLGYGVNLPVANAGASMFFISNQASTTLGEAVNITTATGNGGTQNPVKIMCHEQGNPGTANNPFTAIQSTKGINLGAGTGFSFTTGLYWDVYNCNFYTAGSSNSLNPNTNSKWIGNKIVNASATALRAGITLGNGVASVLLKGNEIIVPRGYGISTGQNNNNGVRIIGNYIHNSDTCIRHGATNVFVAFNILSDCYNAGWYNAVVPGITAGGLLMNNTFVGNSTPLGVGVSLSASTTQVALVNNLFYGLTTGASSTEVTTIAYASNNNYFNNTSNYRNMATGTLDTFINPSFAGYTVLSGTTGSTTSTTFQDLGVDFSSVTPGIDALVLRSGTGVNLGNYLITAVNGDTLTLSSTPTANATADKVWYITTGKNYSIGTGLKATAFPGGMPGNFQTGYLDVGALQRQETGGSTAIPSWAF